MLTQTQPLSDPEDETRCRLSRFAYKKASWPGAGFRAEGGGNNGVIKSRDDGGGDPLARPANSASPLLQHANQ